MTKQKLTHGDYIGIHWRAVYAMIWILGPQKDISLIHNQFSRAVTKNNKHFRCSDLSIKLNPNQTGESR